ncbi:MAG: hypothetical protein LBL55_06120 [Propionibacteriaceae bacterium]|jgi:hypothetical protein|nr:hypothetical protein [Propionibacteriaceae bacterium]
MAEPTQTTRATVGPQRRYEFILPSGWHRFDLRRPLPAQAERYAAKVLEGEALGDRGALVRANLARSLEAQLREAQAKGVLDLVMPTMHGAGLAPATSFMFAPLELPEEAGPMELLMATAQSDQTARLVEVEDLVALRTEARVANVGRDLRTEAAQAGRQLGLPPEAIVATAADPGEAVMTYSHRVQYLLGHPDRPQGWMVAVMATVESDSEDAKAAADLVVALFDQIMLTVRFHV